MTDATEPVACTIHNLWLEQERVLFIQPSSHGAVTPWPGKSPARVQFEGFVEARADGTRRLSVLRDGITTYDDEVLAQAISRPDGALDWLTLPPATPRGRLAIDLIASLHEHRDADLKFSSELTRMDVAPDARSWHLAGSRIIHVFEGETHRDPETDAILGWTVHVMGDERGQLRIPVDADAWWWPAGSVGLRPEPWPQSCEALFAQVIGDLLAS